MGPDTFFSQRDPKNKKVSGPFIPKSKKVSGPFILEAICTDRLALT
jgi:hypothetical protein